MGKRQVTKKIISAGHVNQNPRDHYSLREQSIEVCPYSSLCKRNCRDDSTCRTRRFYKQYPRYITSNSSELRE